MQLALKRLAVTMGVAAAGVADAGHGVPLTATIAPNDNRVAAGRIEHGVWTVRLEARVGVWQPDGPTGRSISTAACAEEGKTLETPGPLLRVPMGIEVRATVRNALAKPLWLFGMGRERGLASDSVQIAPGATREVHFRAAEAGTYYYAARTDSFAVADRLSEDSQLSGVIIVDAPDARPSATERIFAITSWIALDSTTRSGVSATGPNGLGFVFNGRAYPGNTRLELTQGDSVLWRFINLSRADHPLHLHGFYFRVDARGDGHRDTL